VVRTVAYWGRDMDAFTFSVILVVGTLGLLAFLLFLES
jgi:hypothetical protein